MNMNNSQFETSIQKWVALDNQLRNINERTKTLRDEKNHLEKNILQHIETNKLNNAVVSISDGKLKFVQSKQTPPLSLTFVEECLMKCISNQDHVNRIMKFIKSSRPHKICPDIKRIYNEND
jgi:hypothetical protein